MEKLRTEYEELKTHMNGEFGGAEGPRKRVRDEGSKEASGAAGGEAGAGGEFWSWCEDLLKGKGSTRHCEFERINGGGKGFSMD